MEKVFGVFELGDFGFDEDDTDSYAFEDINMFNEYDITAKDVHLLDAHNLRGAVNHATITARFALGNEVSFKDFSVLTAMKSKRYVSGPSFSLPASRWDGTSGKVGVDQDGIPFIVHLPGAVSEATTRLVNTAMTLFYMNATKRIRRRTKSQTRLPLQPRSSTKSSRARNKPGNFVNRHMHGVLETGIIAEIGHFDRPARAASSNFATTVTEIAEIAQLNKAYTFPRAINNRVLDIIDPNWRKTLSGIRPLIDAGNPTAALVLGVDKSLVISHTLTWNRQIDAHFDSKDCIRGWAALHVAGDFKHGGDVYLPRFNLSLRFIPGDVIFLRGVLVEHLIKPFSGGHRFAHTSYTPASFIKNYSPDTPVISIPLTPITDLVCYGVKPKALEATSLSTIPHHRTKNTKKRSYSNFRRKSLRGKGLQYELQRMGIVFEEMHRRDEMHGKKN